MYDENKDSIEELRRKHFEDLAYSEEAPKAPDYTSSQQTYSTVPPTSATPVKAKKPHHFLSALLGALVGGLIVLIGVFAFLYFNNSISSSSYDSNSGPVINYTGGDVESQVEAVAQVVPTSVVGIYVTTTTTGSNLFGQPTATEAASLGSGFFVTDDGYIVTNQHVTTDNPNTITISTESGDEYDGTLVWSDESLDLAIIKINATGVQPLNLGDSDNLKVGQTVIAVGNPLGLNYSRTVTSGIISAIDRTLVGSNNQIVAEGLIQTDAAINSGNSGGPLVNVAGEVIGINTYKSAQGEGIGFAIPINLFKPIIQEVIETGSFSPRALGITGYDPEQAKYSLNGQLENFDSGFYIVTVSDDSPAQRAGLEPGDIIKAIDGKEINTLIQLRTILYNHKADDVVELTYERGGQEYTTQLTIATANQ